MVRFTTPIIERLGKLGRIDTQNWILYDVRVNGHTSRNGRRYTDRALIESLPKFDGAKIFDGHSGNRDGTGDIVGVLKSPRKKKDGIYADAHLLKTSTAAARIFELVQKEPNAVAISHEVDGQSYTDGDGVEIVESINEVLGVAIVCYPGITNGLWESSDGGSDHTALPLVRRVIATIEASLSGDAQGGDASTLLDQLIQSLAADPTSGGNAMRAAKLAAATINHALSTPDNVAAMAAAKSALRVLKQVSGVAPAPAPADEIELSPVDPPPTESPFEATESARYRQRWESRTGGNYEDRFARASERAKAALRRRRG